MRKYSPRKKAFGIITAIIILVLVATIGTAMLSFTSSGAKQTADDYLHEQAELLAKSATEFAVMRIQGFDRGGGNCLESIDITVNGAGGTPMFDINTTISYIFAGNKPSNCNTILTSSDIDPDSNGTAIIDVVVSTDDYLQLDEPIVYHRRTLQKP